MDKLVNVKFKECTREEYDAMDKHANNVVYSCYDTGELFKGDIQFSEGSGGGGSTDFLVTYHYDDNDDLVADKTFDELISAAESGKNLRAILDYPPIFVYVLTSYTSEPGYAAVAFSQSYVGEASSGQIVVMGETIIHTPETIYVQRA